MSRGRGRPAPEPRVLRLLPLLLVAVSLLPNLKAALPLLSYYFGELSLSYLPLRLHAAQELRAGRLALWNPYVFEGSFQLPSLYPPDLLHALWPSPVFVSWLLTLHLPLAALAAWWLARELGASRPGAFLAGAVYALSGFTLSCLNLGVALQALALAPFVAGLLRRAARDGGRAIAAAALVTAAAVSTLAASFVLQAVLLGVALGLAAASDRSAAGRLAGAVGLALGIAALPIALVVSLLPDLTLEGIVTRELALRNAVHPAALVQTLLPHVFGFPQSSSLPFWGGRFFGDGLPYLLSLYLGPLTLALALVGLGSLPRRERFALLALAALGTWFALGDAGGLAGLVAATPLSLLLRDPAGALLLPQLAIALSAGFAVEPLAAGRSWGRLAAAAGGAALVAVAVAVLLSTAPAGLVAWSGVDPGLWPQLSAVVRRDAGMVLLVSLIGCGVALAAARGVLGAGRALSLLLALAVVDLARGGIGINPQAHPSFFEPLPELRAQRLFDLDGARVFSYGLHHSPAFAEYSGRVGRKLTLADFYLERQLLHPYASVLDGVELAETEGDAALAPRAHELSTALYDPARIGELLPWLRNAGVARVLSLDPVAHPALVPLATVPAGPAGLEIHVYGFDPWPRASLACRASAVATRHEALNAPYRDGFDPWREVAVERLGGEGPDDALAATCTKGRARRGAWSASEAHYEVESNASAYLVVRASYARGWRAEVDGVPVPVVRANGKHRAIAVNAGRHEVVLRYHPPGLVAGAALSLLSLLLTPLVLAFGPRSTRR